MALFDVRFEMTTIDYEIHLRFSSQLCIGNNKENSEGVTAPPETRDQMLAMIDFSRAQFLSLISIAIIENNKLIR